MNYKIIFPIVGLVAIIGIVFALNPIQESDNNLSENLEKQAIEIVKSYQGIDGQGEKRQSLPVRNFSQELGNDVRYDLLENSFPSENKLTLDNFIFSIFHYKFITHIL